MPWTQVTGVTFPPGAHLWDHEPHYDTPALCGEWKQDAEVRRVKDGTDLETLEEYLTEACNDKDTCAKCLRAAKEVYLEVQ